MTTKIKIISGFLIMVALIAAMAILGFRASKDTMRVLNDYNNMAMINVAASDLENAMGRIGFELFGYATSRDDAAMTRSKSAVSDALKQIAIAEAHAVKEDRKQVLAEMKKVVEGATRQQDQVQTSLHKATDIYMEMREISKGMIVKFKKLAEQAQYINDIDVMLGLNEIWENLAAARSSISRYAESFDPEGISGVEANLAAISSVLEMQHEKASIASNREIIADVTTDFNKYRAKYAEMKISNTAVTSTLDALMSSLNKQTAAAKGLNADIDQSMRSFSSDSQKEVDGEQQQILLIAIVSVLAAIAIASFIVFGLIRVLRELADYAREVSRGNFKYEAKVTEGGEIGSMLDAMHEIPATLDSIVGKTSSLANHILSGNMRKRMNLSEVTGSFADLAKGINSLSDAYTGVLDIMPVPIMACNGNMKILYLNKLAQGAVGGDFVGDGCAGHLKSPDCNTEGCFGRCTMERNAIYADETDINPQDHNMNVQVTAIPLHDAQQKTVGFLEIINDLTELKQKQNTIFKVANEASDISQRVAAASEELAAQVEQISRGAEIQRTQIESTSSAMTQMNATVLDVARNAGRASEQSQETRIKAEEGAALVGKVVASINMVNKVSSSMQVNMQDLGQQADDIGGVMNVISDIADQTNLLALNAAIEAARAGEAGRGFAVVADEVRKLAEKTMSATQEVARNIDAVQQSARVNIAEMSNAAASVAEATELANASGQALKQIVELAAANSEVVTSIATAAEEQSATSEEISRALDEINQIVGETTDGMAQSSSAVQDLSHTAQQLRTVMNSLS